MVEPMSQEQPKKAKTTAVNRKRPPQGAKRPAKAGASQQGASRRFGVFDNLRYYQRSYRPAERGNEEKNKS